MNKKQTRKKIGLALGGGGAKGLAHIGVIKILEKYDIPIDYVAGTSMGALVGGWYAAHRQVKLLENLFLEIEDNGVFPVKKLLKDKKGILFSDKIVLKALEGGFRNKKIEDCQIPFRAVATNVETGEEVIIKNGLVVDAVRASISLPIIFKPVKHDGKLLMDGGFVNPVPADIVRQMGADYVIAVDVSSKWLNIEDESVRPQDIYSIISKTFSALEYQIARRILKDADIVIRPAVLDYDWLDFNKADQIIKKGEDEALEAIEDIQQKTGYKDKKPETLFEKILEFYLYE